MRFVAKPKTLAILLLAGLAFVKSQSPRAQEPAGDQSGQSQTQKQEGVADNATLNLHRWGAITLFHGLPSDRINAIAEDARGSLWFATDNGLVRYDGTNVEAVPNESALPSRRILALKLDERGNLWIGTEAGAARLREDKLEVLDETRGRTVTGIAASPQNEIAFVTAQGEIIRYPSASDSQPRSESNVSSRSSNNPAAIRLDPNSNPYQLKSPNPPGSSMANEALPLTAITSSQGNEWTIGSSGRGLLLHGGKEVREATARPPRPYFIASLYNDGETLWIAEQASKQTGGLWAWRNGTITRTSLNAGPVTAIHGGGIEVWAGTARQGVYLINSDGAGIKTAEHLTFENTAGGLRSNTIRAIYRDREGIVWFGTDRGVCRYDRTSFRASQISEKPQSNFVRALLHSHAQETWCGTNRGLFKLSGRTRETNHDAWIEIGDLQGRSIYALAEDASGAVWAGTSGGLFVKSKSAAKFTRAGTAPETQITIENEPNNPAQPVEPPADTAQSLQSPNETDNPQSRESVRALATFRGHVYAAFFERGIERMDGDRHVPVLGEPFARQTICFANEADAALWVGTSEGELWRYDGARAQAIPLPQNPGRDRAVRALVMEKDQNGQFGYLGRMWIGTAQGLYLREGGAIREIKSGLNVYGLLPVEDGLWIATQNSGLIKYRHQDAVSIRFDTEQGLASQQVFALSLSDENDVMIGTSRGITRHRPGHTAPKLAIRRLVADKIYTPEYLTAELPLPYPQAYFLLEVTGLGSGTYPSQFQYEFTLTQKRDGVVSRVTKSDPHFAAENLAPGPYAIAVRAINRDLMYSEPLIVRLRVHRAPFPWTTLLLASLLGVAVIAAIWAFRQQRRLAHANLDLKETNIELSETRLRLANETETERSRIARDLHDQTLADLRHLLVLTDQLPAAAGGDDAGPSPAQLRREIESISSEIRHICEDLSPSALENLGFLPALEWALADAVAHLPAEEKFAYEFTCEPELEDRLQLSHIEQIQLYRIVQEALNNICRHAKATQVNVSVKTENGKDLLIEITDDGVGFDGSRLNKTGHGVANIRSRANLIQADVEWHNLSPGCRFAVRKLMGAF